MSKAPRISGMQFIWVLVVFSGFLCMPMQVLPSKSARSELAKIQEQTGLSLVTVVYEAVQVVVFSHRSLVKARGLPGGMGMVSPDGSQIAFAIARGSLPYLAISRTDGSDLREYPNLAMPDGNRCCWSHDKSRLVINVLKRASSSPNLLLLNATSGDARKIADTGSVTTQCWSPEDKQFVYEMDGTVQVFDLAKNQSRLLANGKEPTWSPDGRQIAFLADDTYYTTEPPGRQESRPLFKKWHAFSGLWWSPDSRFVAYVSQGRGLLEMGIPEAYVLRVRRLKDNAEDRVAFTPTGSESYVWVRDRELLRDAESNLRRGRARSW